MKQVLTRPRRGSNNALLLFTFFSAFFASGAGAAEMPAAPLAPAAEIFEDWQTTCAAKLCSATTRVRSQDGATLLAIEAPGAPADELILRTPLPLYLPDGRGFAVGGRLARDLAWVTCNPAGCEARMALDEDLRAALKAERGGSVEFTLLDGSRVRLPFSLMGFSAALAAAKAGTSAETGEKTAP